MATASSDAFENALSSSSSSLAAAIPHPTPSYRIAMNSGSAITATAPITISVGAAPSTAKPAAPRTSPRCSVVASLPEGLLGPPAARPARYSLPPKLAEPPAQALLANARASLPPPPPSPALRRRAAMVFYAIVTQFFLSIGNVFCAIGATIVLFSFGLECLFGLGNNSVLAFVVSAYLIVLFQLITTSTGLVAFNGKNQVEVKSYLLTVYLAINTVGIFADGILLFITAIGGALSFVDELDCAKLAKSREYAFLILACLLLVFASVVLVHMIASIVASFLLCWASDLFVHRSSTNVVATTPAATTPTSPTSPTMKNDRLSPAAPPIKRFSQV